MKLIDCTQDELNTFISTPHNPSKLDRFKKLSIYWSYYKNIQYVGLQYDWSGRKIDQVGMNDIVKMAEAYPTTNGQASGFYTPLAGRRPSDHVFVAQEIVDGFTSYLFGHRKFPKITTDDEDIDGYITKLKKKSHLEAHLKAARNIAGSSGTSVLVLNYADTPAIDVYEGRFCTPIWAHKRSNELAGLEIMYEISRETVQNEKQDTTTGKTIQNQYQQIIYERRVITSTSDTTFRSKSNKSSPVAEDEPTIWEQRSQTKYNLDFVPAIWIRNTADSMEIDGESDYEGLLDDMDTINRIESAISSSLFANLDPTLVMGISPEDLKKQGGRPIRTGSGVALIVGKGGDAFFLEINGEGIKLAQARSKDKQRIVFKRAHYISLDPEKFVGETLSGTALITLLAEMYSVLDDKREQWGRIIVETIEMFIKMHQAMGSIALNLPKVPNDLEIQLQWSPFTELSATEKKMIADALSELLGGFPAIDQESAVSVVASIFGLDAKTIQTRMQQQKQDDNQKQKMGLNP